LMNKEGFPESLSGLQLRHAMQKVASSHWSSLSVEEKKSWKDKAQMDYEKKMKQWRSASKQISADENKRNRNKAKIEIDEILHRSKISFQDADAEGVVAMEQRIQQLTQTLSRVGRVLDRHREDILDSDPGEVDTENMRKRVHAPLRVLSDKEVVDFMWNSDDGVVLSLLRKVEASRFVRPCLIKALLEVRHEFSTLESKDDLNESSMERRQLKIALLKLRSVICRELKEMNKEFRHLRAQSTIAQSEETTERNTGSQDSAVSSDSESEENIPPVSEHYESNVFDNMEMPESSSKPLMDLSSATANADNSHNVDVPKADLISVESHSWLDYYSERFVLHVAADLLLMYAHTSNFFVIQPYRPLQSTPIDVYARELGNEVPKSVIDVGVSAESLDTDIVAACTENPTCQEEKDSSFDDTANESDLKRLPSELCAPDDIVSKVTVTYDGDYISSQLLQWYNAGIGQKPGLPDLLGCTLLPRISDCWSSELFRKSKLKPDRRTTYEAKIRPKLVEWLQDPYQRGSAWPSEIRKAFVGEGLYKINLDSCTSVVAFGSPVMDFLVMGDESNIMSILNSLDVDDRVTTRSSTAGLLTSVDKGRPAQAVSTWVQCEHPTCMKWRKIPWFVDPDVLPERFYCEDNRWNPQANSCDAPEDDWDGDDAMVGSDGKVEGSPLNKRKYEGSLPVNEESSFRVGGKFFAVSSLI
jgi:CW-type Zinc Finger